LATVFRPTYTKPVPADAEIIEIDGTPYARFTLGRGKQRHAVTAPLVPSDPGRCTITSVKWYVRMKHADCHYKKVPGYAEKAATVEMGDRLQPEQQIANGGADPAWATCSGIFAEDGGAPVQLQSDEVPPEVGPQTDGPRLARPYLYRIYQKSPLRALSTAASGSRADWAASHAMAWSGCVT
jgi:hypothetical protein